MSNGHHSETRITVKSKDGDEAFAIQRSPFPSPVIIDVFEKYHSGSAERMLRIVEKEQDNYHEVVLSHLSIKKLQTDRVTRIPLLGMCFGFSLSVLCLVIGAVLLYLGKEVGGYASMLVSISILAKAIFSKGK